MKTAPTHLAPEVDASTLTAEHIAALAEHFTEVVRAAMEIEVADVIDLAKRPDLTPERCREILQARHRLAKAWNQWRRSG
jgi:hypothetical protein